ncbi:hypothetical protein OSB04_018006 [Centaurea solstitialis]|uniref:Uncharacterized protein n=1 Tax=Centaurea solstitialis TaxID=347529 RepID=A0AA38TEW9_9ASTR|nr:hypothetical protein OSB04_018006 [Centaurea solstitialis]
MEGVSSTIMTLKPISSVASCICTKGYEELEKRQRLIVVVRDLVEALLLVYEKPEASERYICTSHAIRSKKLVEMLKKYIESDDIFSIIFEKLQKMGWSYRPLEETLVDSVESYTENGILSNL